MPRARRNPARLLIKSYGEFWRKDFVDWSKGKKIVGWSRNLERQANFWGAKGIYALFDKNVLIYVGQTTKQSLGDRLKQHLKDEFKDRWDYFSWYGIQDVRTAGKQAGLYPLGAMNQHEHPSTKHVLEAMESIAIRIADPPLNRKRPKFGTKKNHAEHFHQLEPKKSEERLQKELLTRVEKKLDQQQKDIQRIWNRAKKIK